MKFDKTDKELRKFGLIFTSYSAFFYLLLSKENLIIEIERILILLFVVFSALTLSPRLLLPFNIIWDVILNILRWINTRILLGTIFYFIFTPVALFRRVFGKDILQLSRTQNETYRINTPTNETNDLRNPY